MTPPPGNFGLPVLGETLQFFRDPEFATKRHQQYGNIFKTRLLGQPTIFVKGPEANQFVLSNENDKFIVNWPTSTQKLLGPYSLSMQMGEVHRSRRKILAQAFMPRALSGYIPTMQQKIAEYTDRWIQQQELTWYPELRDLTLDIACELLVGIENGSQRSLGKNFEGWVSGLFSIPLPLPWTSFGKALRYRKALIAEISDIIRMRQERLPSTEPPKDALGLLLTVKDEEGQKLSNTELNDQILTLLFAGHETLTSSIATFCLQMALHPEICDRLRTEVQSFKDQPLTLERIKAMTYLETVLQEVLRVTPPVGGGFRKIIKDCQYGGYDWPAGWQVLYSISATQDDANLYPEAKRFNPDRFETDPLSAVPKYGYLPFGGGLRECLGKEFARLELKLFAIHLLQTVEWTLQPDQDLSLAIAPTPYPKDGLKISIKPHVLEPRS